jgi:ATP-dependent DNA helicase RecQ
MLADAGRPARAYHAGMKADERSRIQEWFMASDDAIVVATIAFGMGVDKSNILAALFRQAVKGRSWFSLDPAQAAAALNTTRGRIVTALDWLGEQELMEIKVAGVRHRYRRLQQPTSEEELACELHQRILQREQAELDRVQQVMDLIDLGGCQTNALARHFGERRKEPCGHCGWCLRGKNGLFPRKSASINEDIWREACELQQARPEALTSPRLLARFLCGITSPRLSHGKFSGHTLFGSLVKVPFGEVLLKAEQDCNAFRSSPIFGGPAGSIIDLM